LWDIRSNRRGWNPGGYYNAGVDAAIQEWFAATDPDAMKAAATAIQHGINEDLFGIWFGFPHDTVLVRDDIQGFNANMFLFSQNSHRWWRGEGDPIVATPVPASTPSASPDAGTPEG
jgi:ABC-type transport system substrate-binding protein